MSKVLSITLAALATLSAVAGASPHSLLVDVAEPKSTTPGSFKVLTTITNTGDKRVNVLNDPHSPLSTLPAKTFTFTNPSGGRPAFKGVKVKYSPKKAAEAGAFTVLEPGESKTVEHDLTHTYDFTTPGAGDYAVQASDNFYVFDDDTSEVIPVRATSREHKVKIPGNRLNVPRPSPPPLPRTKRATIGSYTGCSDEQQRDLLEAGFAATFYATGAQIYLDQRKKSTERFTTWFGNFTPNAYDTVLSHYTSIGENKFNEFAYDCSCTDAGTFAYVYPDEFGTMYICGAFWSATLVGTDSKGGTLVHEASHFTKNGGTDDYAYGQPDCRALAQENQKQAIMNADSHQYFAENNPALL